MRADFLQEGNWSQETACPRRRAAVEEEQTKIYHFLTDILALNIPELDQTECNRARNALVQLFGDLGFTYDSQDAPE